MTPNLDQLISDLTTKLQLDPWTSDGDLVNAPVLSLLPSPGDLPASTSPASDFRWRDCEPLLEQASALLDRALTDRTAFQSSGEKFATFSLDVKRTIELIKISDRERNSGRFETPYLVSSAQYNTLDATQTYLKAQVDAASNRSQALSYFNQKMADQSSRAGWLEYLHLSDPSGPPPMNFNTPLGSYKGPRVDMANAMAQNIEVDDRVVRLRDMQADMEVFAGQLDAAEKSLAGAKSQRNWDDDNRQYLAARADLEKVLLTLKLAMAQVEWLLDFRQQMLSIAPRYRQTVRDAYDRLVAVQSGMVNVYGRCKPDYTPLDPLPPLSDDASVDAVISWTRRTGTWLAALTRRSHNYIFPVSLKAASTDWDGGKALKQWTFVLPQITFDQQCYIRVRGMAGWVVGGDDGALWTLDVQLPGSTTFVYEGGATRDLNQGLIKCKISAVTSRGKLVTPNVVGLTSCYNASPIGSQWIVRATDAFNPGAPGLPDDIQLDLYLSVLPL